MSARTAYTVVSSAQITDSTTVGRSFLTLANPGAIRFVRINANNTITALDADSQLTALGGTMTGLNLFKVPDQAEEVALTVNQLAAVTTYPPVGFAGFLTAGQGLATDGTYSPISSLSLFNGLATAAST